MEKALEKTGVIIELLETPKAERDGQWMQNFTDNVAQAAFKCGNPQLMRGVDGFYYFQLFVPKEDEDFGVYIIEEMIEGFILEEGVGIVIEPEGEDDAEWVFGYGDLVNYHLYKEFYTKVEERESIYANNTTENEKVLIGAPAESYLPAKVRAVLHDFFSHLGYAHTHVLLLSSDSKEDKGLMHQIVFSLDPASFDDETELKAILDHAFWYLPRHYEITAAAKDGQFQEFFKPL